MMLGNMYNFLIPLKPITGTGSHILYECKCVCGNTVKAREYRIVKGLIKSCGCMKNLLIGKAKATHRKTGHPVYDSWKGMMDRCYKPHLATYHLYGGRGIVVCERWKKFENFWDDMADSHSKGLTLDRVDVNGNYSPDNCRWATRKEQSNNTRRNVFVTANGETLTISEWARKLNIHPQTLYSRRVKHPELNPVTGESIYEVAK